MDDFESYFASLEDKIHKTSRLQILKEANSQTFRDYKVNALFLVWLKFQRIVPYFAITFVIIVLALVSLFMMQNKSKAVKANKDFLHLEYSYVDEIKEDFPWQELELSPEKEKEIKSLVSDYKLEKQVLVDKIAKSESELEVQKLNYQLRLLASDLSLKIRFLLSEEETHRFFRLQ